jgi:GDP-mannose pyrophosphatase NudK
MRTEVLSDNWYTLNKISFDYRRADGTWQSQVREAYDRGNGAAILLYNPAKGTVILTRQFRMPTYVNGNESGLMIEACAGLLDADEPEACIRKEAMEETGYRIGAVERVCQTYTSPGSVTEILHLFVAEYSDDMKEADGGGLDGEGENIEVLEMPFEDAWALVKNGGIRDAKTIILLQHAMIEKLVRR